MEILKIERHGFTGAVWVFGWLFTIGFAHLTFWQGVFAVLIWPYYLGMTFGGWMIH